MPSVNPRILRPILLLLSVLSLGLSSLVAQVISGEVLDRQGLPIVNVHLTDTVFGTTGTLSGSDGQFAIEVRVGSVIRASHIGFTTTYLEVSEQTPIRGSRILMMPTAEMLGTVTISADPVVPVIVQHNVNILDYLPFSHYIITLKKRGAERLLAVEGIDTTFAEFALKGIKGRELFQDCFGHVYVLSQDSSYQIYADTALYIVDAQPIDLFEALVRPCIADLDDHVVLEDFRMYNKRYVLEAFSKTDSSKSTVYTNQDMIAAKVAAINLSKIIARYHYSADPGSNVITNGVWDGDLIKLQVMGDNELTQMVSWYLNVRGREVDLSTVKLKDHLVVFDMLNDSIHVFNKELNSTHRTAFSPPVEQIHTKLIVDRPAVKAYLVEDRGMTSHLHEIDVVNGEISSVIPLDETFRAENIKVSDGWAYYLMADQGYHKLYRSRVRQGR